jgi:predicted nucleic acid-binding protein
VPRLIALDSDPLWLASLARGKPEADRCRAWIALRLAAGDRLIIPEVVDYEVRREFLRRGATAGLARLDDLKARLDYRPITTPTILLAAELWAQVRRAGMPTAGDEALDGDCIAAAQALIEAGPGVVTVVATKNSAHLSRFPGVVALDWRAIN